ncbi:uncharacterized protein LOC114341347 [Diabrotica virgifera virgifera]|nr:uncharacterized protein LOC114341347 [Diabrotica virgifera virgifera]
MDDLLQYVLELSRESALLPSVKGKSQNNSHQEALVIRENATLNLFNDSSTIDVHEEIIVESEDPTKPGSSQQKIEETPGKKRTILTPKGNRRNVGLKQSSLDYLQKKMTAGLKSGVGNWHSKRGRKRYKKKNLNWQNGKQRRGPKWRKKDWKFN